MERRNVKYLFSSVITVEVKASKMMALFHNQNYSVDWSSFKFPFQWKSQMGVRPVGTIRFT